MFRAAALLLACSAASLPAQDKALPIVGSWTVAYQIGSANRNGTEEPIMGRGMLTVTSKGDSLVGKMVLEARPGGPPAPDLPPLMARADTGKVVFTGRSTMQRLVNGEASPIPMTSTWTIAVRGDSLTGTIDRVAEGTTIPRQPVNGARVKKG